MNHYPAYTYDGPSYNGSDVYCTYKIPGTPFHSNWSLRTGRLAYLCFMDQWRLAKEVCK